MNELTENEQQKLNTGRLFRAEADLLLPLIQTKTTLAVGRIIAAFRANETDKLLALAAELSTLEDMRTTIKRKISEAESLERKVHSER